MAWFKIKQINDYLVLIYEPLFLERANCWLIKGPGKDVIIDAGLGVCNLRNFLEQQGLISSRESERECTVICTHSHFDHSGGAHQFDHVLIHENDANGLRNGQQTEVLNYVKASHFELKPYPEFSAFSYKVPPTQCTSVSDGERIDIGNGEYLQILHTPGHTRGSITVFYPEKRILFTGDFVYDCGSGGNLFDWLPSSCVRDFVHSANYMIDFINDHDIKAAYPGHFEICTGSRVQQLLTDYVEERNNLCSICCATCVQSSLKPYFFLGCFRCCPC